MAGVRKRGLGGWRIGVSLRKENSVSLGPVGLILPWDKQVVKLAVLAMQI